MSSSNGACFLCGQPSESAPRPQYLHQVKAFKTYLCDDSLHDNSVETCVTCAQDMTSVWRLHQQLIAIRLDIATIVDKVRTRRKDISKEDPEIKVEHLPPSFIEDDDQFPELDPHPHHELLALNSSTIGRDPLALSDPEESSPSHILRKRLRKSTHAVICPTCRKVCPGQRSLDAHIQSVHQPPTPVHPPVQPTLPGIHHCDQCGRDFQSRSSLISHQERFHPSFNCSSCGYEFDTMKAWAVHEATVCLVPGRAVSMLKDTFNMSLIPCGVPECGQLLLESDMARHSSTHHENQEKGDSGDFMCQGCGDSFVHNLDLWEHQAYKHRGRKKHVSCPKCPMIFYNTNLFKEHLQTHANLS